MPLTSIRLPDHLARDLDEIAARRRATRSELVREAVEEYGAGQRPQAGIVPISRTIQP